MAVPYKDASVSGVAWLNVLVTTKSVKIIAELSQRDLWLYMVFHSLKGTWDLIRALRNTINTCLAVSIKLDWPKIFTGLQRMCSGHTGFHYQ